MIIDSMIDLLFFFLCLGLWGVVNTAGLCCRGRLEAQDGSVWDAMLRLNVVGSLRAARALLPLLRNKRGNIITIQNVK